MLKKYHYNLPNLSNIKKICRFLGGGVLSFYLLTGCVPPPIQEPPSPTPPAPPRMILVDTPASLAVKALLLGEEAKAFELARGVHNRQEREALLSFIKQWSLDRQAESIRSKFESKNNLEAFDLLMKIKDQSLSHYRNLLLTFRPETLFWIIRHETLTGQEQFAIRTMVFLQQYKRTSFNTEISSSYAHWALRRFQQHRYHDALKLAHQSLAVNSGNKTALGVRKRTLAIRDAKVSRGLVAYRHQHLEKAIRLWKWALAIDPSNEETKKYILEAEELLKKVKHLQGQPDPATRPVQGEKK